MSGGKEMEMEMRSERGNGKVIGDRISLQI
jgi:hypothetical protein